MIGEIGSCDSAYASCVLVWPVLVAKLLGFRFGTGPALDGSMQTIIEARQLEPGDTLLQVASAKKRPASRFSLLVESKAVATVRVYDDIVRVIFIDRTERILTPQRMVVVSRGSEAS